MPFTASMIGIVRVLGVLDVSYLFTLVRHRMPPTYELSRAGDEDTHILPEYSTMQPSTHDKKDMEITFSTALRRMYHMHGFLREGSALACGRSRCRGTRSTDSEGMYKWCHFILSLPRHITMIPLIILRSFFLVSVSPFVVALWPMPRGLTTGANPVKLSNSFAIHVDFKNVPQDLQDAVQRTKSHLTTDAFERLVIGRGATDADVIAKAKSLKTLVLTLNPHASVRPIAVEVNTVVIDARDESYILTVPSDGSEAKVVANSTLGLFRGLTTFDTMWYHQGGSKYILNAPLTVTDSPAFVSTLTLLRCQPYNELIYVKPYRGFSFDTARNLCVVQRGGGWILLILY